MKEAQVKLQPILKETKPIQFEEIIMNSNWDQRTKKDFLVLFKNYESWYINKNQKKKKIV